MISWVLGFKIGDWGFESEPLVRSSAHFADCLDHLRCGFGFEMSSFKFRISGSSGFRLGLPLVLTFRCRVLGLGFRVSGFEFWFSDFGFQVSSFGALVEKGHLEVKEEEGGVAIEVRRVPAIAFTQALTPKFEELIWPGER